MRFPIPALAVLLTLASCDDSLLLKDIQAELQGTKPGVPPGTDPVVPPVTPPVKPPVDPPVVPPVPPVVTTSGGTLWAKAGLGLSGGRVTALVTATDGTHFLAGYTGPAATSQAFLVHVDAQGTPKRAPWTLSIPDSNGKIPASRINGMALDPHTGNLVVVGEASNPYAPSNGPSVSFGMPILPLWNNQTTVGFVALFKPDLTCLAVLGTDRTAALTGVATYQAGTPPATVTSVLVVGNFVDKGTNEIGTSHQFDSTRAGSNGFLTVVPLGTGGTSLTDPTLYWFSPVTQGDDWFNAITVDQNSKRFAIAGAYRYAAGPSFSYPGVASSPPDNPGHKTPLILEGPLTGLLNFDVAQAPTASGTVDGELTSVALDANLHTAAGGTQTGSGTFTWAPGVSLTGPATVPASTGFVVLLNDPGQGYAPVGLANADGGSQVATTVTGVAYDFGGRLLITGNLSQGTYNWAGAKFTSTAPWTPFVARMTSPGSVEWVRTPLNAANGLEYGALAIDPTTPSQFTVAGTLTDTQPVEFPSKVFVKGTVLGDNPFLSRVLE